MVDRPELTASLEDYLESIYNIASRQGAARVTDIAADLQVAKSSVTAALKNLSARALVNYDPYSLVTLTSDGEAVARRVVRRHAILAKFIEEVLGMSGEVAEANACRLEHAMEAKVVDRLLEFVEFIERCPRAGDPFRAGFARFATGGDGQVRCEECLEKALESAREIDSAPCRADGKLDISRGDDEGD